LLCADHHLIDPFDYLRMMTTSTLTTRKPTNRKSWKTISTAITPPSWRCALQTMADGLPAIGIVAAVLGVIKTMGSEAAHEKNVRH
jgi:chemotaxis protein MotA